MRDSIGLSGGSFRTGMHLQWRYIGFRAALGHFVAMVARMISVLVPWRLPGVSIADVRDLTEWDELEAAMTTWGEKLRNEGRTKGRAEGRAEGCVEGRVGMLVSIARERFGEAVAGTMSALLEAVRTESALDEVGKWLVTCETGDALIAKIRQM